MRAYGTRANFGPSISFAIASKPLQGGFRAELLPSSEVRDVAHELGKVERRKAIERGSDRVEDPLLRNRHAHEADTMGEVVIQASE